MSDTPWTPAPWEVDVDPDTGQVTLYSEAYGEVIYGFDYQLESRVPEDLEVAALSSEMAVAIEDTYREIWECECRYECTCAKDAFWNHIEPVYEKLQQIREAANE